MWKSLYKTSCHLTQCNVTSFILASSCGLGVYIYSPKTLLSSSNNRWQTNIDTRGMMMKNKQVIACLAGLLIINICDVTSLPLSTPKEKVERDVQSELISTVSPIDSDQSGESVDSLILRKNILEKMLKETNERLAIKQKDEIVVDVRTLGPAPLGRRPPRPAKKTTRGYEERELDSSSGDINTLKQILQRLEARSNTEQDTTTAPVSSVDILHEKLRKLDADVHKLLNKQGSPSKRNREGPYPKELILDEN